MIKEIPSHILSEVLFTNLVLSLANAAMMSLGKSPNPVTNQIEKDLEMAEMNIEILGMLQEKTRNNLSDKEETLLTTTLTNLRMNYVAEKNSTS